MGSFDWLSRALARAGVLALADAEEAIRQGRVKVNGKVVRQPLSPLTPGAKVQLDGNVVALSQPARVLAFHKPAGVVTSRSEREGDTVFSLLLPQLSGALRDYTWHAVGRLDRDTTGLLLFTNDEKLLQH